MKICERFVMLLVIKDQSERVGIEDFAEKNDFDTVKLRIQNIFQVLMCIT